MVSLKESPYSPERQSDAYQHFLNDYPVYNQTTTVDTLRASDYSRLDELGHVYLDYTGGGLYASSHLHHHMDMRAKGVYGNPHPSTPPSLAPPHRDESPRQYILHYFNVSAD